MKRLLAVATLLVLTLVLSGCGYNTLQQADEQAKASWSEVLNQYQRRADLVPNLVNTVKGFAAQEQKVLIDVTNALGMRSVAEGVAQPEQHSMLELLECGFIQGFLFAKPAPAPEAADTLRRLASPTGSCSVS